LNRDFKGIWIPKEIWFIPNLKPAYRVFLAEIDSLDKGEGCWAQNGHFADLFGLSKNRCSEFIQMLEKENFIEITYEENDGIPDRMMRLKHPIGKSTPPSRNRQTPSRNRQTPSENRQSLSRNRQPLYKDEIYNEKYKEKYKERDVRALEFLKSNFPSRFEQEFLMRYSKGIKDLKKFEENFNDAVDVEQLDYVGSVLFARLGIYARNWLTNQDKFSVQNSVDQKPNYLADGD
jgi:hypothetical protein